jgi:hypothetical protein
MAAGGSAVKRSGLLALLLLPFIAAPVTAADTVQLALPSQQPDGPPPTPVGDPDVPPIGLDIFQPDSIFDGPAPFYPADN